MATAYDPRITAYFGDAVLQAGFMPLPHLFLRHYRKLGLSHVQAMFVLQLMEIAWDLGDPPINVARLAERMDVSPRTVRQCSQDVHALGLVEIYDQFDASGAQVENGYDLSPLFRRLAALAPVTQPEGQFRIRRSRTQLQTVDETEQTPRPIETPAHLPLQESARSPLQHFSSPPLQDAAPSPCEAIPAPPAAARSAPGSDAAALKKETKNHPKKQPRNRQEQADGVGVAVDEAKLTRHEQRASAPAGRSLRWNCPLDASEVAQSQQILARMGLTPAVSEASASALHPAESWALRCYARGAGLGPGWVASQCYDFATRRPQAANLAGRYDEVGRLLAALPSDEAEVVLDIVDNCCPEHPQRVRSDPRLQGSTPALWAAVEAAWSMMAEQRGARGGGTGRLVPLPPSNAGPDDPRWSAVRMRLAYAVAPDEWSTWIEPLRLLDVLDDTVVLGAPNVFVRDHVFATYGGTLAEVLEAELARPVRLEVVIGTPILV